MKNLFLIDGASGTGKSDLLRFVEEFHSGVTFVRKFTTREKRGYESSIDYELDLEFVEQSAFERLNCEYEYVYSGHRYGFSKTSLDAALVSHDNVFIIVRNARLIKRLTEDYNFLNVIPVYIYTDENEILKRLAKDGQDDKMAQFRLERLRIAFEDFLRHPDLYREILINNSSVPDYHRLIDLMIAKYQDAPFVDEKMILVLMSFNPDNYQLADYYRAMQRAVQKCDPSYVCTTVEELPGSFKISDATMERIRRCRLAIVDLTENKPNVLYELGFIHGIAKDCIITAHQDTPALLYPREYRLIYYRNAVELESKLSKELPTILKRERNVSGNVSTQRTNKSTNGQHEGF